MSRTYRVACIPGDGIGREVMMSALQVLEAVEAKFGIRADATELDWGCQRYLATGSMMPADGLDQLASFDAIFLGAVGDPRVPDHVSLWGLLIPIRRRFGQYVNVRPVRLFEGVPTPLAHVGPADIDLVVVRENTEGEYSEIGGRFGAGTPLEFASQQSLFTRVGVERIVRYAFELARTRSHRLTSATKSNGIVHTLTFWDEIVHEIAHDYPSVQVDSVHIDALCGKLVLRPSDFDVIVASNLFGDLLSDLAAAIAGSIGIAPSANVDPTGENPSMFEPVHGSAPDIAGSGRANPTGQVWSLALMLEHLGELEASAAVQHALELTVRHPSGRTSDIGGTARTADVTAAIVQNLATLPSP